MPTSKKAAPAKKPAAPAKKPAPPAKKPAAPATKPAPPAKKPAPPAKKSAPPAKKPAPPAKKPAAPAKKPAAPAQKPAEKKTPVEKKEPAPVVVAPPAPKEEEVRADVVPLAETYDRSTSFVSTLPPEIVPAVPSSDDDDLYGDPLDPVAYEPANFSKKDLAAMRARLLALRSRLSGKAASLQGQSLTRADEVNPEEDGTDAIMRNTELKKASDAEAQINQIDAALRALDAGTYGVCQSCGKKIGKARLEAHPFATLCVGCQHEEEVAESRRAAPPPGEYY